MLQVDDRSLFTVPDLELRTSGPAGEFRGDCLGAYQLHTEEEGLGRVYKQRHNTGDTHYYMYRLDQQLHGN